MTRCAMRRAAGDFSDISEQGFLPDGSEPFTVVHGSPLKAIASGGTHSRRVGVVAALAVAAAVVCAAAVAVTLWGNQSRNPGLEAEIRALMIALPIAVGLFMWNRDPWRRFARLLVIAGFAWSLTTLAQSDNDLLYSTGRVFGWFVE